MLDSALRASVQEWLQQTMGRPVQLTTISPVSGGCINQACAIETDSGHSLFLKWNQRPIGGLLECETKGLEAIRATGAIRVPEVIGGGVSSRDLPFLVLELIETSEPAPVFEQELGRRLAALHRFGGAVEFGFDAANFIGSTLQRNTWHADWLGFWKTHRLGFQLHLARDNGYGDHSFSCLGDRLLDRMDTMLLGRSQPALIHGDLWSGNCLADENGLPVLVDPATYYADREAEFGMTTLFGGYSDCFYDAYQEVWPLEEGADERIEIYRLYHLLNHLNLFGTSYMPSCLEIMRKYS